MVKDKTISHYCAISNLKHKDLSETDEAFSLQIPLAQAMQGGQVETFFPD